jgi:hypothetical protein
MDSLALERLNDEFIHNTTTADHFYRNDVDELLYSKSRPATTAKSATRRPHRPQPILLIQNHARSAALTRADAASTLTNQGACELRWLW